MAELIHFSRCPVCESGSIEFRLNAIDNTVSKKTFPIWECRSCTARFTQDVPDATSIGEYYRSEDYISHTNTNKGLVNRAYHVVRQITLNSKRKLIEGEVPKGTLLDVGSGTGAFAGFMQKKGWEVTALEPDPDARSVALSSFGVKARESEMLFQLTGRFDAITLWHVLEHVHDLRNYVTRLRDLLKPGGRIFIAVPNYTSADAVKYGSHWAAYDVPRHLYHFSPGSIKVLMEAHGLRVLSQRPMWFDSYYVSLLSTKIRKGKPDWANALWVGSLSNAKAIGNVEKCSSVIYVVGV